MRLSKVSMYELSLNADVYACQKDSCVCFSRKYVSLVSMIEACFVTDDKSDQGDVTSIVTREGTHVDQVSLLPKKVFVLVGTELYFFPDDEVR